MTEPERPKLRRINRGSGHSYTIDGDYIPGVTTILKVLAKNAFIDSAARKTAGYAIDHWDELEGMTLSERYETLCKSRFLAQKQAMRRGKEVHALAERLSRDEEVDVPHELEGYVDACVDYLNTWRPEPILTENPVFNLTWGYGGTLDVVERLPDDTVRITDYKTGGTGIYWDTSYQLAAYRHCEVYLDHEDGHTWPMADLDITGSAAVWIRADGWDVYELPSDEHVFERFLHAIPLWHTNEYEGPSWRQDPLPIPNWDEEPLAEVLTA